METIVEADTVKVRTLGSPNALNLWLRLFPFLRYLIDENTGKDVRILGEIERIRAIVKGNKIRKIYIALESVSAKRAEQIQFDLLDLNVDVIGCPICAPTIC